MTDTNSPGPANGFDIYRDGRVHDRASGKWYTAHEARNTPDLWKHLGTAGKRCVEGVLNNPATGGASQ